jgi:excisionase family DNA binding protein
MTIWEVADYPNVTERTIYRRAAAKKVPAFKVGGTVHVKQLVASSSSHGLHIAARKGSVLHLRSFRVEGDGFDV